MRTLSKFALGAAFALSVPMSLEAQRQGALELGGFGRYTQFADTLQIDGAFGGGGRAGIYVLKNLLLEMDLSFADADVNRPRTGFAAYDTLNKVSHTLWNYRLLYNAPISDRVKLLVGGGYAYDAYGRARQVAPRGGGPSGLVGLRFILSDMISARIEGIGNWVPGDEDTKPVPRASHFNLGAQAGLSVSFFTRERVTRVDTVVQITRDTVYVNRIDTVRVETPGRPVVIGAINFAFARDVLTDEAKVILDQIASSLNETANSSRTIDITGNTDAIGSERFNDALGLSRAEEARDYLVSKGVAASRIAVKSNGEVSPIAPNNTDNGRATNRRVLIMLSN